MEPLIGQIILFGGNFDPRTWAYCDGQLLSISSNTALFSILGTTYGGDGRTTFALPDLRGRTAIGARRGPGLSNRPLGQRSGDEQAGLSIITLPSHNHSPVVNSGSEINRNLSNAPGIRSTPAEDDVPSVGATAPAIGAGDPVKAYGPLTVADAVISQTIDPTSGLTLQDTGQDQTHNNMQPFETVNYIIALQGIYPSRS